jgi:fused signal recognition particle receptor
MITLFGKPEPTLAERLKASVSKTKAALSETVDTIFLGDKKIDPSLLRHLETALLSADLGVKPTREILDAVREKMDRNALSDASQLKREIKSHVIRILNAPARPDVATTSGISASPNGGGTRVIFIVGVNGAGKTTSIGKLANRLRQEKPRIPSALRQSSNWRFGRSATASKSSSRNQERIPQRSFTMPWPQPKRARRTW